MDFFATSFNDVFNSPRNEFLGKLFEISGLGESGGVHRVFSGFSECIYG